MKDELLRRLAADTERLREQGLYKVERVLSTQQARVRVSNGTDVLNLCANNYLGLANHPAVREAAHRRARSLRLRHGLGALHLRHADACTRSSRSALARVSRHATTRSSIRSCFDANGGLFETLLDEQDAVISDALNHASIIDGIRLCKAQRLRYANSDLDELRDAPQGGAGRAHAADRHRRRVLDGRRASPSLTSICDLADRYGALVMVDDSHAVGFVGRDAAAARRSARRRSSASTSSPARSARRWAAPAGGYTVGAAAKSSSWLRQRSRPYLFSNSIPPVVAAAERCACSTCCEDGAELRERSCSRTRSYFRAQHDRRSAFEIVPGEHPIIPVMLGDAALAARHGGSPARRRRVRHRLFLSRRAEGQGPHPHADVSAGLTPGQLERAVDAFTASVAQARCNLAD